MKACARCGKGARTVIARSHSMIATKRRQKPNLQSARWQGRRVLLCTSCLSAVTRSGAPVSPRLHAVSDRR